MKTAAPTLSSEQKRVQEAYKLAWWPAMMWMGLMWVLMSILADVIARLLGWKEDFNQSGLIVLIFPLVDQWTIRKLKRQGISLASEKTESLARLTSPPETSEKAIEWGAPKMLLGSLAKELGLLLLGAACWFLCRFPFDSLVLKIMSGLGVVVFCELGFSGLIFLRHPRVRIDSDGIVAKQNLRIPRRVRWDEIAELEVRSVWNYLGNGPTRFLTLRSTENKKLLRLNYAVLSGLSLHDQGKIEREIRRRFQSTDSE